jgi:hypothetical protein
MVRHLHAATRQELAQLRERQPLGETLRDELSVRFAAFPRFLALTTRPRVQRRQDFLRERRFTLLARERQRKRRCHVAAHRLHVHPDARRDPFAACS